MTEPDEIERVLRNGAERAAAVAEPVLAETKRVEGSWNSLSCSMEHELAA